MQIKKGDTVYILTGKDRGKTGKVLRVNKDDQTVVVEGVRVMKKHKKPRGNTAGQIVEFSAPIHVSNVMFYDTNAKQRTRIGKKLVAGKYVRVSQKTNNQV